MGIDIGLNGGIAIIDKHGVLHLECMPTKKATKGKQLDVTTLSVLFEHFKREYGELCCAVEKQSSAAFAFNGGGRVGTKVIASLFYQVGVVHGLLDNFQIPYIDVRPQDWKKEILEGTKKDKFAAIQYCMKRFPKVSFKRTARCTKAHDGFADATCMALFCKEKFK